MDVGVVRADPRSAPFFAAAARDELLIKRCGGCARWLGPEAAGCPGCGADDPAWAAASGRGTLVSFAVLPGDPPSVLALVELDEGPWLHTGLVAGPAADSAAAVAGMRVRARFEHPADGESYPLFGPDQG